AIICSSQLSARDLRTVRSLKYTRTTMSASATSSATKKYLTANLGAPGAPSARAVARKIRTPLLEERADALGAFRPHRVRGDGLALENHLRLEGAERGGHEALGGAVGARRPGRELRGDRQRPRLHLLVRHHLVDQSPAQGLGGRQRAVQEQKLHGALGA